MKSIYKVLLAVVIVILVLPAFEVVCKRHDITSMIRPTVAITETWNFLSAWTHWFGYQIAIWLDWGWWWQKFKDLLDWLFRDYIDAFEEIFVGLFRYILIPYEFIRGYMAGIKLTYTPSFNAFIGGLTFIVLSNSALVYYSKKSGRNNNIILYNLIILPVLFLLHIMMVIVTNLYYED